ncbi:plastocyanin/azurin family copper-binding protein [Haloarchaeobius sp. HRN-SO-5]|uniref:plastocyanin/azurin family copper-binding protein n=1 Tax=Haloarchaeobius sp. HRN-SO-5 TaxID=3446118 RepID=UPI003EBEACCF
MADERLSRRRLLGIGATALPAALAGCLGGGGGDDDEVPENTVIVGPDNTFVFEPDSLTVSPGTEVTWEWDSNTHNVVVESQPDGADWPGTEGGESQTFDEGYVYSYTFEVPGTYTYYCSPHRAQGMQGEIIVEE